MDALRGHYSVLHNRWERLKLKEVMGLTQGYAAIEWYQIQLLLIHCVTLGKSCNPSDFSFPTYKMKKAALNANISYSSQPVTVWRSQPFPSKKCGEVQDSVKLLPALSTLTEALVLTTRRRQHRFLLSSSWNFPSLLSWEQWRYGLKRAPDCLTPRLLLAHPSNLKSNIMCFPHPNL